MKIRKPIALITLIVLAIVIVLFFSRDNNDGVQEVYTYDCMDPRYNYSENSVMYFDNNSIIHYIDTETGKDIILCDRPNCPHKKWSHNNEDPDCPAVFYGLQTSGGVYFNDNLYFVGNMTNEDTIQTQYLYEMAPNGADRKIIATIPDVQSILYVIYRDHYVIGAYCNTCELGEDGQVINDELSQTGIFVVDLNDCNVMKSKLVNAQSATIRNMYYTSDKVYYVAQHFPENMTTEDISAAMGNNFDNFIFENILHDVYEYDISSGKTTQIHTFSKVSNMKLLNTSVLYNTEEGYFKFDISSETSELIKNVPDDITTDRIDYYSNFVGSDNDYYYCCFDTSEAGKYYYYHVNKNKETLIDTTTEMSINTICNNSIYINYYDDDGNYCLGVINKQDFDNSNFKIKRLRDFNYED